MLGSDDLTSGMKLIQSAGLRGAEGIEVLRSAARGADKDGGGDA